MIASISNFPSIPSLQTLSISNNNLNDLSNFTISVRTKFPNIRTLNTFKNPMNPGFNNPGGYNQYRTIMKQVGNITELDGININDNSFMNQGQQSSQQRDLFGLFGTSGNTNMMASNQNQKVNFFGNTQSPDLSTSTNVNMTQAQPQKKKMSMFDILPNQTKKPLSQSTMIYGNSSQIPSYNTNVNNGKVLKRQFFIIDESQELDGTEFVNSKKKKSLIMFNEKIFKKSDNMTNFNRKNRSEGNKHILNSDL